jgi:hypothetical protein
MDDQYSSWATLTCFTTCLENYHVFNNVCVECAEGTTRSGGDPIDGPNTFCAESSKNNNSLVMISVAVIIAMLCVLVVVFLFVRRYRKKQENKLKERETELANLSSRFEVASVEKDKLAKDIQRLAEGWLLQWQDVRLEYQLAKGGYGEVWRGRYRGRWDVAVKKMFDTENVDTLADESEIHFLQRARHPRLVLFMGAGRMPDQNLFIVLEYMEEGALDTRIDSDLSFPWSDRLRILGDIAEGMAFLHDKHGSVHRDLKSGNVLLDREDGLLRGKIADFGMSKFMSQNRNDERLASSPEKNSTTAVDVHSSMTNGLGTWCSSAVFERSVRAQ